MPKATVLGRRRNFVVAKFDFGGGDIKMTTININSVKLHTHEPLCPYTDGGARADAFTTTATGDTTITDSVSVQVFGVPAPTFE